MSQGRFRVVLVLLMNLLALPSHCLNSEQAELELPQPDGRFAVGTETRLLRDARRDRQLLITIWYPAAGPEATTTAVIAPYLDKRTAEVLAEDWGLEPGFERSVHTHARLQASIAGNGPFPVVFLEHGSGVVPAAYTVLSEGMASHGFVVVATNHPPDSLIAVYPDGHEEKARPYWPVDADRRTQGVAIGKFAEDVLVADVRFVLDQLQEMNAHDNFWRGHLDLERVGIVGHSMGGTTAALATKEEARILAGVNLDGSTYPGMNGDVRPIELHKPLLFMETEEHASDPASHGREYMGSQSNTYYAVVAGNDHMAFTDKRLIQSRFASESKHDRDSYERALAEVELTRSLVEEFLGRYLKHEPAPVLDGLVRIDRK